MLKLYQLEECSYCTKVRKKMSKMEIDYILRNVQEDNTTRNRLHSQYANTVMHNIVSYLRRT